MRPIGGGKVFTFEPGSVRNGAYTAGMTVSWIETDAQENHAWLLHEFASLLTRRAPASVLDVGCGSGLLMRECKERGIPISGLDQAGPRLEGLRANGFEVHEGSAYELPFEDQSFDWVSMRHVPHHLEYPDRAFAEALRVAKTAFFIAEPCFDATVPSQRGAIALDRWEKRQHRRRGMFHAEVLDVGALLSFMPSGFEEHFHVEVQRRLRLRRRSITAFTNTANELTEGLPQGHPERTALAELLELLERTGLTWNGSSCLTLLRHGTSAAGPGC